MKLVKLSLAAAVIASSLAAEAVTVSGDASFTSNYIFRGASFTDETATVQSTLGVEHESGVYAGIWASGLTVGTEIDLYAGYATEVSGLGIDIGFVSYGYTGPDANDEYEYVFDESGEVYAGLSYDVGVELGATVYKGMMDLDEDSTIIEVTADKDLEVVYIGAAYGHQLDEDSGDNYYSATVGKSFEAIKGDLSFTYASTDADNADAVYALTYTTSF
jgi:uncharacterized protein (TIGR02001 family)